MGNRIGLLQSSPPQGTMPADRGQRPEALREAPKRVAAPPDAGVDEMMVDTFAMRPAGDLQNFDVVVTPNTFGYISATRRRGLVGGPGKASLCIRRRKPCDGAGDTWLGARYCPQRHRHPHATIEPARMTIEWLGHDRGVGEAVAAAGFTKSGIESAPADPASRIGAIGGTAATETVTQAIVAAIEERKEHAVA